MNEVSNTKSLAESYGLSFKDFGNGHVQIENHGVLVNYWPMSRKRTAQVKGEGGINHCSPWDAVQLCLKGARPKIRPDVAKKIHKGKLKNSAPGYLTNKQRTNPVGIKHPYNGDTAPWECELPFRFNHPSDELRALAYAYEEKAVGIRAAAQDLEEQSA